MIRVISSRNVGTLVGKRLDAWRCIVGGGFQPFSSSINAIFLVLRQRKGSWHKNSIFSGQR